MKHKPKILLVDIETAPATAYVWRLFDENIGIDQLITPGRIICWGAKWHGQRPVFYADERGGAKKMFLAIHALMSEADAIVTYNGDKFDLPKLNGAFIEYGLPPLPPATSIDLLKTVRKMGAQSNKLAFIAPHLRIGDKVKTEGFRLWAECLAGSKKAWDKMKRYNAQDVRLLGPLYDILLPHIKNHPYLGGTRPEERALHNCPRCQSQKSQSRGYRRTKMFLIQRIQCLGCGGWYEGKREKVA